MSMSHCECQKRQSNWVFSCLPTQCQCPGPDEIIAVMEAMNSEPDTQELIKELYSLLQRNTKGALPVVLKFLSSTQMTPAHRTAVLQAVERLLCETGAALLDEPLAKSTVSVGLKEMTMSPNWLPNWQQAGSNIVVSVVRDHYHTTMDMVLSYIQPGELPHHALLQAVSDISCNCILEIATDMGKILELLVPLLPLAKNKKMKAMIPFVLGSLCESWTQYQSQAPADNILDVSQHFNSSYDIMSSWLPTTDLMVTEAVVLAFGPMCRFLSRDTLQSNLLGMVYAFLPLYAVECNFQYSRINKSLSLIVEAGLQKARQVLYCHLNYVMIVMHSEICKSFDPPEDERYIYLIQSFIDLAKIFPQKVLEFVLDLVDSPVEQNQLGSLTLLFNIVHQDYVSKHLKEYVLKSFTETLGNPSNKVKCLQSKVLMEMEKRGYLGLEGTVVALQYIVKNCALADDITKSSRDHFNNSTVRHSFEAVLCCWCTDDTVTEMLWSNLLKFISWRICSDALPVLCKHLNVLYSRLTEKGYSLISNFEEMGYPASPDNMLIRLLLGASQSLRGGHECLTLLHSLSPIIHPRLHSVWEHLIPPLARSLTESQGEEILLEQWQEGLYVLLSNTLSSVADEAWACSLTKAMTRGICTLISTSEEKAFLCQCVGVAVQHVSHQDTVRDVLQDSLLGVRYERPVEREGLAVLMGLCASAHPDVVLSVLEGVEKTDPEIYCSELCSESDFTIALILCYGHVALKAPGGLLHQRMETDFFGRIRHFTTKDSSIRLTLCRSVGMISQAVLSSSHTETPSFPAKAQLLETMMTFIKEEPSDPLSSPVRLLALRTCVTLSCFNPVLPDVHNTLLHICAKAVLTFSPEDSSGPEPQVLYSDLAEALLDLLLHTLQQNITPARLQEALEPVQAWLSSAHTWERVRAIEITKALLLFYLENFNPMNNLMFPVGELLGLLFPRCCDTEPSVREKAMECVITVLDIWMRGEGGAHKSCAKYLNALKESVFMELDQGTVRVSCSAVTQLVSQLLPQHQLKIMVRGLFDRLLLDSQPSCSSAACITITHLFQAQSKKLASMFPDILHVFVCCWTLDESVRECLRDGIVCLASHNLKHTISFLLTCTSHCESSLKEVWQALSASQVAPKIVKHLADYLCLTKGKKMGDLALTLAAQDSNLAQQETQVEPVVLRSLSGLMTIMSDWEKSQAKLLLPYVYQRAKLCLESETHEVRRACMLLLGQLVRLGSGDADMKKEVHTSLVILLLNLSDPIPEVTQACRTALMASVPLMGFQVISAFLEESLSQDKELNVTQFIKDMASIMIKTFPSQVSLYQNCALKLARSRWAWVRESAAIFIGLLVQQQQKSLCSCLAIRRARQGLRVLLQDQETQVQERAAESMRILSQP
ncbi:maestro heat-like repeat-containing protein family member 1 isoform X2 [Lepisosteus oculatus]|uniref:maestro heat-like repeat-containing protein family member 1 isoform X2 n=1 Tax=Lepisosteus oculatus TaxID=7918 RepID=UPI00371A3B59